MATFSLRSMMAPSSTKLLPAKEVELPDVLDGETVDDDISLAALVPLYGIDTDFLQFRNAELFDAFAHHGYLVAVRNDDAYRLLGIETLSIEAVDAAKQVYYDCCLVGIDLIGYIPVPCRIWMGGISCGAPSAGRRAHLLMGEYMTAPSPTGVDMARVPVSPGR